MGRMWLVHELVFTFSAPIKYAKVQFNSIILPRVIAYTTYYYTTTDRLVSDSRLWTIMSRV